MAISRKTNIRKPFDTSKNSKNLHWGYVPSTPNAATNVLVNRKKNYLTPLSLSLTLELSVLFLIIIIRLSRQTICLRQNQVRLTISLSLPSVYLHQIRLKNTASRFSRGTQLFLEASFLLHYPEEKTSSSSLWLSIFVMIVTIPSNCSPTKWLALTRLAHLYGKSNCKISKFPPFQMLMSAIVLGNTHHTHRRKGRKCYFFTFWQLDLSYDTVRSGMSVCGCECESGNVFLGVPGVVLE